MIYSTPLVLYQSLPGLLAGKNRNLRRDVNVAAG